jgi:hypothetical protein
MSYIVVYVKIVDDKKDGLVLDGPHTTEVKDTQREAEEEARKTINDSRNCTIIPRPYFVNSVLNIPSIIEDAREYFENIYTNMREAKEVMCRPVKHKKRRKPKVKKSYEIED